MYHWCDAHMVARSGSIPEHSRNFRFLTERIGVSCAIFSMSEGSS
uniref:Uncharacterized protein n=1 Tax=virus sp. ctL1g6 TaxID=2827988 RepID=A0A8S5RF60_9VIRU|nr:MAG TPA: hypothetical protein [virus sp. ctL1g6]